MTEAMDDVGVIPVGYYEWLYTIERDVRVWELTPNEIKRLTTTLAKLAPDTTYQSNSPDRQDMSVSRLKGALAAILADPDCCAASKAIARDGLSLDGRRAHIIAKALQMSHDGAVRDAGYALDAHIEELTEALKVAASALEYELSSLLNSVCLHDSDGPVRDSAEAGALTDIERLENALAVTKYALTQEQPQND